LIRLLIKGRFKSLLKMGAEVVKELLKATTDRTVLLLGTYLLRENLVRVFLEAGVDPTARQEALEIADTDKRNCLNLA
jgi:hypothetical protein